MIQVPQEVTVTEPGPRPEQPGREAAPPPSASAGARSEATLQAPGPERAKARRRATHVKWAVAVLLGAAAVVALVLAWLPDPVLVDLAPVDRGPLTVTVDEDGRTRLKDRFVVSAPIAGTLIRPGFRVGDAVRRGEVIARVTPAPAQLLDPRSRAEAEARVAAAAASARRAGAVVAQARSARDFAERDAERQRGLLREGAAARRDSERADLEAVIRGEELSSAELGRQVAEAELRQARAALLRFSAPSARTSDVFQVLAPVDGRVLRVFNESGGVVPAGAPLFELGDPAALEIVVDVLSADAVLIAPGAPVRIEQWGGDAPLRGHVHRIEPAAFTRLSALGVEEQRVNVVVDLDNAPASWAALGDGYRVEARITVWHADDVVRVPAGSVFRHGEGWAVYAVRNSRASLTPVEIAQRSGTTTQIVGGLEPGDVVVVYPGDTVSDGVKLKAR